MIRFFGLLTLHHAIIPLSFFGREFKNELNVRVPSGKAKIIQTLAFNPFLKDSSHVSA